MRISLFIAGVLACGVAGAARSEPSAVDVIATRQAGYDLMSAALGAANLAVKADVEVKAFAGTGAAMSAWAKQIPSLFPPGSDKGNRPTKAKPAIWTDWATFEKDAAALDTAATKLADLAKANDKQGFVAQLKVVGGACLACHRRFRAE
jgi:cytochrome c556